ncbi:MAG: hypothetical protein VX438_13785 [Planctomycetota bacterium]|nr:hypothetical protein [Planctomycetota bacterium]
MKSTVFWAGQNVDVSVSEIRLNCCGGEFHGNIDFRISFSQPVDLSALSQSLVLRIPSSNQYPADELEVVGCLEIEKGFSVTMSWEEANRQSPGDLENELPEVELCWGKIESQVIGRFPVKAVRVRNDSQDSHSKRLFAPAILRSELPPGVLIQELSRGQNLEFSWWDRGAPFMLVAGVLATWLPSLLVPLVPGWGAQVFRYGFTFGGILIFYHGICKMFNRTRVEIEGSEVRVLHGPLPWFNRSRVIQRTRIKHVRTKKQAHTAQGDQGRVRRTTYSYAVQLVISKDEKITVMVFPSSETATLVKQKLKAFLAQD